jgi:hypothetical protein
MGTHSTERLHCTVIVSISLLLAAYLLFSSNSPDYFQLSASSRQPNLKIYLHSFVLKTWLSVYCFLYHRFVLVNAGLIYIYFTNFQSVDEEEYGGAWELTKEGFMTSFAGFLVGIYFI